MIHLMIAKDRLLKLAAFLFLAALFTVTWDKICTVDVANFSFRLSQLLFFLAFLLALPAGLRHPPLRRRDDPTRFALAMGVLAAYYMLGAGRSYFPLKSFLYAGWLFFDLTTIWFTAQVIRRHLSPALLVRAVQITIGFHGAVILIDQVAFRFGYTNGLIGFNQAQWIAWGFSRPHAFSFEPSYIASFFCMGILLTLPGLSGARRPKWHYATLLLAVFALVATTSRTGWFGLLAGLAIMGAAYFWRQRSLPWKYLGGAAALGAVVLAAFLFSMSAEQRHTMQESLISSIARRTDGSGEQRLRTFQYAWQMARETHYLGTGLGASFKYWSETTNTSDTSQFGAFNEKLTSYEVVLSTWGQLLAEGGLPAVILFALAGFFLLRALWRRWLATGDLLTLGSLAGAAYWFFFGTFWLGNIARGDVWIWYALWALAHRHAASEETT